MRRLLLALTMMLGLASSWSAAAAPAPSQGPVWWKISNGAGAVLWVLGMPDGMLIDVEWNDASLRWRMASADRLVSPLLGPPLNDPGRATMPIGAFQQRCLDTNERPTAFALSTTPGAALNQNVPINWLWWRTLGRNQYSQALCLPEPPTPAPPPPINSVTFKDSLSGRLTPEMMQRVERSLPFLLGEARSEILNGKTWEVALWMDVWNWPRGEKLLGNPITARAQLIAKQAGILIDVGRVPALWKPILIDNKLPPPGKGEQEADYNWLYVIRPNIRIDPPETLQQKCLERVLTETEGGQMPTARTEAMQAWARGDLDNALKRSNTVQLCLMGDKLTTDAGAFETSQASLYIEALNTAFDQPGQRVALIEFDPLLLEKDGVLSHYRQLGYEITTSDGMQ